MVLGFARVGVLTLLIAVGAMAPVAISARAQAADDAAALDEARKLIANTKVSDIANQLATMQMQVITDLIVKSNPGSEQAVRQIVDEVFLPEFLASIPALLGEIANLYTLHFTAAELRELNAFYSTPIGVKTLQVMPALMQQSVQLGQVWGQKVAEDALKKAQPKFRERGITL